MRILHVPYSFYPDPAGGTEVYVRSLAQSQRALGIDAGIAAPAATQSRYIHEGLDVLRFPVSPELSLPNLYGHGDPPAARAFGALLDEYHPDLVHFHALTPAINTLLSHEAKMRNLALVFNYHTPTVSCPRGDLLIFGTSICDGTMETQRCSACKLHSLGTPLAIARIITGIPPVLTAPVRALALEGGLWTALRMPELIDIRIGAFQSMMGLADKVVALCNWTRELLLRNGIPDNKLVLCRQGIEWNRSAVPLARTRRSAAEPLRAVFLGRMDATKGPGLLVEALRSLPDLPIQLDLYGVRQGRTGEDYASRLEALIGNDSRIRLLPAMPSSEVVARLAEFDVILVPSQWLETGPLVVLEAFAAGTPVIGSNLGGVAELVTDGVDGLLVSPFDSTEAWGAALARICRDRELLDSLTAGIRPPRHSSDAARELMPVYEEALAGYGVFSRPAKTIQ